MKRFALTILHLAWVAGFVLGVSGQVPAQDTPEAFLALLPPFPDNCCTLTQAEKDAYLEEVDASLDGLDAEIDRRKGDSEADAVRHRGDIRKQQLDKSGFSVQDAQRLETAGEAGQMAVAEKMLASRYNLSMDELDSLKDMSEEEQAAWAQANAAKLMAAAQSGTSALPAQKAESDPLFQQAQEQKTLLETLAEDAAEIGGLFAELENDPMEKAIRENEIMPLETKVGSMIGAVGESEGAELDRLSDELRSRKRAYCERFFPRYRAALDSYLGSIRSHLPTYHRLEQLQAKSLEQQTGVDRSIMEPGLMGMEAVREYVGRLRDLFRYDLRTAREMD